MDLARLRLPISSLYERYKHNDFQEMEVRHLPTSRGPDEQMTGIEYQKYERHVGSFRPLEPQKKLKEGEAEIQQMFWFQDARLMHLNEEYSREQQLKLLRLEVGENDLLLAYDDIIKFNNYANEFNYIVDLYSAFQAVYMGGVGSDFVNEASWTELYRQFDSDKDNLLNKVEIRDMIRGCGEKAEKEIAVRGRRDKNDKFSDIVAYKRATDAETDFVFRMIASSG